MDREAMALVAKKFGIQPLEAEYPFYQILEVASNNDPEVVPEDSERLIEFLDVIGDNIGDGVVPQGETASKKVWDLRENVAVAACEYGYTLKYDLSLPTKDFYNIV